MGNEVKKSQEVSANQQGRIRALWRFRYLLKWLPRKRSIGRYPVLGKFASFLKNRNYLWCFNENRVAPAILLGSIIAFLPIFGIQLITVMAIAIILKVNLPVIVGLQFISNPLTLAPIYLANYKVGKWLLQSVGFDLEAGNGLWLGMNSTMLGGIVIGSLFGLVAYSVYQIKIKWPVSISKVAL